MTTTATVAEHGAHAAPAKASSNKQATPRKHAPKAGKPPKGAKSKRDAKPTHATAPRKPHAGPRAGGKGAKVFELLARSNGASLSELMKATRWQAHSVRGFLSTVSRKRGMPIESLKNSKDERVYRFKK